MSEPKNTEIEHFVAPFEETPVAAVDAVKVSEKKQNLWTDAWSDMRRRPMFWISAAIILLVVIVSLFPTPVSYTHLEEDIADARDHSVDHPTEVARQCSHDRAEHEGHQNHDEPHRDRG